MNRRALLVAAIAAVLLVVVWYVALWSPRNSDLEEARDRKEAAEQQNRDLETRIARLQADQRREPELRAAAERLRTAVPDQPNLAQFILDANDAAVRAGIDFISIAPSPPTAPVAATTATTAAGTAPVGRRPAEIALSLQIQGGYFQVLDFLNRLNDLPRIVVLDGLNLSADQSARLSASLTARMFVQPEAVAVPGATTTTTVAGAAGGTTTTTAAGAGGTTTTVAGATTTTVAAATTTTGARP